MFVVSGKKDRNSLRGRVSAGVLAVMGAGTGLGVLPMAAWGNSVGIPGLGFDGLEGQVEQAKGMDVAGALGEAAGAANEVMGAEVKAGEGVGYVDEFWDKQYRRAWVLGGMRGEAGQGDLTVGAIAGQLGVWGLVYEEGGLDASMEAGGRLKAGRFGEFGSGGERTNKDVEAAVAMLERLTGTQTEAGWLAGGRTGNRTHEALYSTSVPLPAALPAGLALLGGLGLWRAAMRRRRG